MCIIVAKPKGVKRPDKEVLQQCWEGNPDGAGFCYYDRKKELVGYQKGFMSFKAFWKALLAVEKRVDGTDPFIYHFRITSRGSTCPEQTHPFPVSTEIADLKKSRGYTRLAITHNGTMPINHGKEESDTQAFVMNIVAPLHAAMGDDFLKDRGLLDMLAYVSGSLLAFLTDSGGLHLVNKESFIEEDGVFYSNRSYAYSLWNNWKTTSSTSEQWASYYDMFSTTDMIEEMEWHDRTKFTRDWDLIEAAERKLDQLGEKMEEFNAQGEPLNPEADDEYLRLLRALEKYYQSDEWEEYENVDA